MAVRAGTTRKGLRLINKTSQGRMRSSVMYLGIIDFASSSFDERSAFALLDDAEKERHGSIRTRPGRRAFLAGRLLAKSMAAENLGLDPAQIALAVEPGGKPRIQGLEMSVAHSSGLAICAMAAFPIGADIECMAHERDIASIALGCFAATEIDDVAMPGGRLRFYARWTLKEARLKMLGLGIEDIARTAAFDLGPGRRLSSGGDGWGANPGYACFRLGTTHLASLAFEARPRVPHLIFAPRFAPPRSLAPVILFGNSPTAPQWARADRTLQSRRSG